MADTICRKSNPRRRQQRHKRGEGAVSLFLLVCSLSSCGIESYQYLYPPYDGIQYDYTFYNYSGNDSSVYFKGYEIIYKLYAYENASSIPSDSTFASYGSSGLSESVLNSVFFNNTVNGYRRLFLSSETDQHPLISVSDNTDNSKKELIFTDPGSVTLESEGSNFAVVRYVDNSNESTRVKRGFDPLVSFYEEDEDMPDGAATGDYIIAAFYAVSYGTEDLISYIFSEPVYIGKYPWPATSVIIH